MRRTFKNWGIRLAARLPELTATACLIAGLIISGLILTSDRKTPDSKPASHRVAAKNATGAVHPSTPQKSSIARGF